MKRASLGDRGRMDGSVSERFGISISSYFFFLDCARVLSVDEFVFQIV